MTGQIKSIYKNIDLREDAKDVSEDRGKWKTVVFAYPDGQMHTYVCKFLI